MGHRLLRFFKYNHLPEGPLRDASQQFFQLAQQVALAEVVDEAERTVALRKLLEGKDCFVRSFIPDEG